MGLPALPSVAFLLCLSLVSTLEPAFLPSRFSKAEGATLVDSDRAELVVGFDRGLEVAP